jgi:hypothetical protein
MHVGVPTAPVRFHAMVLGQMSYLPIISMHEKRLCHNKMNGKGLILFQENSTA